MPGANRERRGRGGATVARARNRECARRARGVDPTPPSVRRRARRDRATRRGSSTPRSRRGPVLAPGLGDPRSRERAAAANVREDPERAAAANVREDPERGPSGPTHLERERRLGSILAAVRLFHRLWAGACRTGAPRLRYRHETSSRAYREQPRRRRPTEGGVPCPTCTPPRTRPRTRPTRVATGACWTRRRADGVARKRDRRDRGFETRAARDPRRDRPTRAESRPRRVRRLGTVHLRRRRGRWRRARIGARPGRASGRRGRSRRARRRRRSARDRRGPPRTAVAPARARGRWSPRPRAPRDANDRPRGACTAGGIVCARPSRNLGRTRRGNALARDRRRRPGPDRGSGAEGWSRNRSLDEAGGARPRRQSVCDRPERAEARRGALGCVRTRGRLGRGRPARRDHRARRRDRHDRVRRVRRRARRRRARDAGRSRAIDRAEGIDLARARGCGCGSCDARVLVDGPHRRRRRRRRRRRLCLFARDGGRRRPRRRRRRARGRRRGRPGGANLRSEGHRARPRPRLSPRPRGARATAACRAGRDLHLPRNHPRARDRRAGRPRRRPSPTRASSPGHDIGSAKRAPHPAF